MADERVWLTHPETGGYFHCPAEAVDEWLKNGWQPSDQPQEVNAATAERSLPAEAAPVSKPAKKAGASAKGSD